MDQQPTLTTSSQQFYIAAAVFFLVVFVLATLSFANIPEKNQSAMFGAVGYILGFGSAVMAFYFPSSVGSRAKDDTIASLAGQLKAAPVAPLAAADPAPDAPVPQPPRAPV